MMRAGVFARENRAEIIDCEIGSKANAARDGKLSFPRFFFSGGTNGIFDSFTVNSHGRCQIIFDSEVNCIVKSLKHEVY